MVYVDRVSVVNFTGFSHTEFKVDGRAMTSTEFDDLIEFCDNYAAQLIHRYCNVPTFELHSVTEYHNGRGASDDERAHLQPTESDRVYLLRENPVFQLTKVETDLNPVSSPPHWVEMRERTDSDPGDFVFVNDTEFAYIRFHNNIPVKGIRNVRIKYTSGYPYDSPQFKELKLIAIRIVTNLLLLKKKYQESSTIRAANVKDFALMFDVFLESDILTVPLAAQLERYRRITIPSSLGYT